MLRNAARFAPLRLARHTQFLPRKSTVKWKSWSILYVFVGQDSTFLRKDELKSGQPVCKFNFYSAKQSTIHPVLQIRWPFCGTRSQYPHASEFQKLNWKLSIKSDTFWEDNCYVYIVLQFFKSWIENCQSKATHFDGTISTLYFKMNCWMLPPQKLKDTYL